MHESRQSGTHNDGSECSERSAVEEEEEEQVGTLVGGGWSLAVEEYDGFKWKGVIIHFALL